MLKKTKPARIKSILIITPNWLGDLMMSFLFFKKLFRLFPDCKYTIAVKDNFKGVLESFAMFQGNNKKFVYYSNKNNPFHIAKQIGKTGFDLFIPLSNSLSSGFVGLLSLSRHRVGYKNECRGILLTKSYVIPQQKHLTEKYYGLLNCFEVGGTKDNIFCPIIYSESFENIKNKYVLDLDIKYKNLLICPKAEGPYKTIPKDILITVLKKIKSDYDFNFIFSGLQKDNLYIEYLRDHLGFKTFSIVGKTNLKEFITFLDFCDLVISNDSGPAHVANTLRKNQIVFFGYVDPAISSPYKPFSCLLLRKTPENSTCLDDWMKAIDPDESYILIRSFLDKQYGKSNEKNYY